MKIAIIGATGCVGSSAAFYLSMSGLVDDLLLIGGSRQNVLAHHAIDLETAAAELEVKVTAGQFEDLAGSDIIINAAGPHQPLSQDRGDIIKTQTAFVREIAQNISQYAPDAVTITAINPIDSIIYATYLYGQFDRSRVLGYSINDTMRFQIAVAKELNVPLTQVEGVVMGEHGPTQVPLFSSVRVDGKKVTFTDEMKKRVSEDTWKTIRQFEKLKAGRTAGWTCAVGLAKIVKAIIDDDGTVIPCSVVLDGEYGQTGMSMAVPVVLGKTGAKEILEYPLEPDEREGLETTIQTIRKDIQLVSDLVS